MINLIYSEVIKLKRSKMIPLSFLGAIVTPLMMILDQVKLHYSTEYTAGTFNELYDSTLMYTILIFNLMVYTVFAAYIFSREYNEHTLKTILTVPVSKISFIVSKFIIVLFWTVILTFISWIVMLGFSYIYQLVFEIPQFVEINIAVNYLVKMILGTIIMFFTISPFIFLTLYSKGLVLPIVAVTTAVMGNAALCNESLGALFPWTSIYLILSGKIYRTGYSIYMSLILIGIISIIGIALSLMYFKREDVK